MSGKEHAKAVFAKLSKKYPSKGHYLNFKTPLDLFVATILSAQVTDERVNAVTKKLFATHRRAGHYARLSQSQLEKMLPGITYAPTKAKNIIASCQKLVDEFQGKVPQDIDTLVTFPGVGRKTANAILMHAFDIVEGIPCDTHVIRLSQRLDWSSGKTSDKVEKDLIEIFPKRSWKRIPQVLKDHGRALCKAPTPTCSECLVSSLCPKKGVSKHK